METINKRLVENYIVIAVLKYAIDPTLNVNDLAKEYAAILIEELKQWN